MSGNNSIKPALPECRFDLIYITDVNNDGVEDMVMLNRYIDLTVDENGSETRLTPIGAEVLITDVEKEVLFERISPSEAEFKPSVSISHEKISDLKAMWYDGKRLEVGGKWKGKAVFGFSAQVVLAEKGAKGKGAKHVVPAGIPDDDKALKKVKAFLTKIGDVYELSIRVYVQFKGGSKTEIVQHDANPMCVGQVRQVVGVAPSQETDRKENE